MADLTTSLPHQALMLEYRVSGLLDGVTPSPPVVLPPGISESQGCRSVIVELDNLGLIDLTGFGQRIYADRIIRPLLIVGPNVPFSANNVAIVIDGDVSEREQDIPPTANGIFVESCIFVPQGHQLQLQGMAGTPTEPVIVRLGIFLADTVPALAKMREACCCLGSALNAAGQQEFSTAIYSVTACFRTITSVAPTPISRAAGTQLVTILGTGFASDDGVVVLHEDATSLIPVLMTTVVNSGQIQVLLDVGTAELGFFNVTVFARSAFETCSATADSAIEITA
jgi:hypothetical protein